MLELIIFKHDLREIDLPDDIDGTEFEALFTDREELDWYILECLQPAEVPTFIALVSRSWFAVGAVSKTNYDSDDSDLYRQQVYSYRYIHPDLH